LGPAEGVGTVNSLKLPPVVTRPILLAPNSVNQRAPSGPTTIVNGPLAAVGGVNSVKVCAKAEDANARTMSKNRNINSP